MFKQIYLLLLLLPTGLKANSGDSLGRQPQKNTMLKFTFHHDLTEAFAKRSMEFTWAKRNFKRFSLKPSVSFSVGSYSFTNSQKSRTYTFDPGLILRYQSQDRGPGYTPLKYTIYNHTYLGNILSVTNRPTEDKRDFSLTSLTGSNIGFGITFYAIELFAEGGPAYSPVVSKKLYPNFGFGLAWNIPRYNSRIRRY